MPGRDGTGPVGLGPMTGRGMGYCIRPYTPGYFAHRGYGRGLAWRRGFGRGYGRGFGPGYGMDITRNDEINDLKDTAEYLKEELKAVEDRIKDLTEDEK